MIFKTKEEAIAEVKDNSKIIFSGFQLSRAPIALINEIAKQKIGNLEIVALPNPFSLDILIKNRLVKKAVFSFNGFSFEGGFQIMPNWRKSIENQEIEYKETDVYEIIKGLEAGIENKEYSEIDWIRSSDYVKYNDYEEKNGKLITRAIKPDFALIHAQLCDEEGNVKIFDTITDNLIWKSAKKVIVSVEEKVEKLDSFTIPKEKISSIIIEPNGAKPTACFCYYNYSLEGICQYLGFSIKNSNKNNSMNNNFLKNKNIIENIKGNLNGNFKNNSKNQKNIDLMICVLARQIKENSTVLTGVASPIPMLACLLAQELKNISYINCSGAISPKPTDIPFSSANICFLNNKKKSIELSEIFEADIDYMFMGAGQIDPNGNINMTCIGKYKKPRVKLPGPAAIISLRNKVKNSIVFIPKHSKKIFVEKVDFITSKSNKDTIAITNLGILKLGKCPEIIGTYQNSSIDEIKKNTGFELKVNKYVEEIGLPSKDEMDVLRKIDFENIRYNL